MKIRNYPQAIILCLAVISLSAGAFAVEGRLAVPRVAYREPKDESVVDLTGKKAATFRWCEVPMPSGGRESIRFRIYKGFTYEVVDAEELSSRTFSVDVPAEKFEDGGTYTWRVQQRDGRSMIWSLYDTWSFTVKKK